MSLNSKGPRSRSFGFVRLCLRGQVSKASGGGLGQAPRHAVELSASSRHAASPLRARIRRQSQGLHRAFVSEILHPLGPDGADLERDLNQLSVVVLPAVELARTSSDSGSGCSTAWTEKIAQPSNREEAS